MISFELQRPRASGPKKNLQNLVAACLVAISGVAYSLSQKQSNLRKSIPNTTLAKEEKTLGTRSTTEFKVELCTDGDTCRGFNADGKKMRVRLVGNRFARNQ